MTAEQITAISRITTVLLGLGADDLAGLELTATPLKVEFGDRREAIVTLYACEHDGTDVTIRVTVDEAGFQGWTKRRYPAETFTCMPIGADLNRALIGD